MRCNSLSASVLLLSFALHSYTSAENVNIPDVDVGDVLLPDAPHPRIVEKSNLLQRAKVQFASSARGSVTTRLQPGHQLGAWPTTRSTHTDSHTTVPRYRKASRTTRARLSRTLTSRHSSATNPVNLRWSSNDRVRRFSTLYEQLYTVEHECSATGTTEACARALPLFGSTLAHVRCERPKGHNHCFWQYLLLKPPTEVRAHVGPSVNVWLEWMQGRVMASFYGRDSNPRISKQKNTVQRLNDGSRATEYHRSTSNDDDTLATQRQDPHHLLATALSTWNYDNFARVYTYQVLTLAAAFLFFGSATLITYRMHVYGQSDARINVASLLPGWHEPVESGLFTHRHNSPCPPARTLVSNALLTIAGCFNSYAFVFCRVPPVEAMFDDEYDSDEDADQRHARRQRAIDSAVRTYVNECRVRCVLIVIILAWQCIAERWHCVGLALLCYGLHAWCATLLAVTKDDAASGLKDGVWEKMGGAVEVRVDKMTVPSRVRVRRAKRQESEASVKATVPDIAPTNGWYVLLQICAYVIAVGLVLWPTFLAPLATYEPFSVYLHSGGVAKSMWLIGSEPESFWRFCVLIMDFLYIALVSERASSLSMIMAVCSWGLASPNTEMLQARWKVLRKVYLFLIVLSFEFPVITIVAMWADAPQLAFVALWFSYLIVIPEVLTLVCLRRQPVILSSINTAFVRAIHSLQVGLVGGATVYALATADIL